MKNYLLLFAFSLILTFPFSQVEKRRITEKEKNTKAYNAKQKPNNGLKSEDKSPSNSFNPSKNTNKSVILSNEKVLKKK
jgi:sortase (surface protein transpeptidase)